MNGKVIFLICCVIFAAHVTQAKRKRSYTKLEYSRMSDERMCQTRKCGRRPKGSWCQVVVNDRGRRQPACVCPTSCDTDDDSPVCSVFGRQYNNKCFLHLEACRKRKNIKISYEGPCIASQAKCRAEELRQFPFRLMDWFVHLKDTNEFGTVDPKKSITSISLRQTQEVAQWKFEDLDRNHDDKLTNKELKQFRYALMPMEHCAKDFFRKCDSDKNKKIVLSEWIACLVDNGWEWYEHRIGAKPSGEERLSNHETSDNNSIQ